MEKARAWNRIRKWCPKAKRCRALRIECEERMVTWRRERLTWHCFRRVDGILKRCRPDAGHEQLVIEACL